MPTYYNGVFISATNDVFFSDSQRIHAATRGFENMNTFQSVQVPNLNKRIRIVHRHSSAYDFLRVGNEKVKSKFL
jgi:hypothetical protein